MHTRTHISLNKSGKNCLPKFFTMYTILTVSKMATTERISWRSSCNKTSVQYYTVQIKYNNYKINRYQHSFVIIKFIYYAFMKRFWQKFKITERLIKFIYWKTSRLPILSKKYLNSSIIFVGIFTLMVKS